MTFTMPSDFGDVVLVPFPFTSQRIVSNRAYSTARPDLIEPDLIEPDLIEPDLIENAPPTRLTAPNADARATKAVANRLYALYQSLI
jgi:hypothetical protein